MSYSITTEEVAAQPVLMGRRTAPRTGIAASIAEVLPRVFQFAQEHEIALTGPPFVRYLDAASEEMTFEPGMPISAPIDTSPTSAGLAAAGLVLDTLPAGTVATTLHNGPYERLHEAYAAIEAWMDGNGRTGAGAPWESYVTDPSTTPDPADWRTIVYWPLATD